MSYRIHNEEFRNLLLSFPGKAVDLLYRAYYHKLLRLATELTGDERAAEDIVQETLIGIWENFQQLGQPHERSIEHYLVRVAKYKSISHYRENLLVSTRHNTFFKDHASAMEISVEARIIRSEINCEIRQLIGTFPTREKQCLFMKLDEELTIKQMAERLKVSEKAVERSLTSGRKRLRERWIALDKKS